jgi:hypothetical protein
MFCLFALAEASLVWPGLALLKGRSLEIYWSLHGDHMQQTRLAFASPGCSWMDTRVCMYVSTHVCIEQKQGGMANLQNK